MDRNKQSKIQEYLRRSLGSKTIKVEGRENKNDSADVTNNGNSWEFYSKIMKMEKLAIILI